ncbi:hypothetical protein HCH_04413 [Hahella chejuensis KCTC 2396]|uniref:Uncharacterized protein n=1 Tax=Hahella chejuensis (strain KCTC 2396) TaxID=349521 RepID=Q2SE07_HAHCH|nr:hypothetical protein [Hahella chejuensis]ABC31117.1 hypothetical protein HCH_04413 [Hahella chejuensis KCTC 2396]
MAQRAYLWPHILYLVNLLALPGAAFLILLGWYWRSRRRRAPAALQSAQAIALTGALINGALLVVIPLFVLWLSDREPMTVTLVLVYWLAAHGACVVWGVYALTRENAGRPLSIWGRK